MSTLSTRCKKNDNLSCHLEPVISENSEVFFAFLFVKITSKKSNIFGN